MKDILLVFDLDLTIIDSQDAITSSFENTLQACQLPVPSLQEILQMIGLPLKEMFRQVTNDEMILEKCLKTYRAHFKENMLYKIKPFPGAIEKLKELHDAGFVLAILTARRSESARRISRHFSFDQLFARIIGVDNVPEKKPNPELIFRLLKELQAKKAILIGDHFIDAQTAQNAQIPFIGILYENGTNWNLAKNLTVKYEILKNIREITTDLIKELLS